MPVNLILERTNQVPYFTEMGSVFDALKISARDYDWYRKRMRRSLPGPSRSDRCLRPDMLVKETARSKLPVACLQP